MSNPFLEKLDIVLSDVNNRLAFDNDFIGRKDDILAKEVKEIKEWASHLPDWISKEESFSCSIKNCIACEGATSGGIYFGNECLCAECEAVDNFCVENHEEDCENCLVPHPPEKLFCDCDCH